MPTELKFQVSLYWLRWVAGEWGVEWLVVFKLNSAQLEMELGLNGKKQYEAQRLNECEVTSA
jgi:hypothetical protein